MAQDLLQKKCQPCEGKEKPYTEKEARENLKEIPGWHLTADHKTIHREFVLKNFMAGVRFISHVAEIAETENHHPDIHLTGYRKLRIDLSTHAIGGLSENDFILAAKINQLPVELKA